MHKVLFFKDLRHILFFYATVCIALLGRFLGHLGGHFGGRVFSLIKHTQKNPVASFQSGRVQRLTVLDWKTLRDSITFWEARDEESMRCDSSRPYMMYFLVFP